VGRRRGDPNAGPRREIARPLSQGGHDLAGAPVHDLVDIHLTRQGEELVRLPGHSNDVSSLAFSPDGKAVVSSSGDSTLRLLDTEPLHSPPPPARPTPQDWATTPFPAGPF